MKIDECDFVTCFSVLSFSLSFTNYFWKHRKFIKILGRTEFDFDSLIIMKKIQLISHSEAKTYGFGNSKDLTQNCIYSDLIVSK